MVMIKATLFTFLTLFSASLLAQLPPVQLANVYDETKHEDIRQYLVSEKYDGVRAIWTGKQFVTRQGNSINPPDWFTSPLPDIWLDGELWTKRGQFSVISGIVRTKIPNDLQWQIVTYQVFDMPDTGTPFHRRYQNYLALITKLNSPHIKAVKQYQFSDNQQLSDYFNQVTKQGGEGVMLHLAESKHTTGRSSALLKLKPYLDAEALVIEHLPGKGKYTGMLGALKVQTKQGLIFSIGTGFSDKERKYPPAIGSTITYRYHGYTKNGLPRFVSFLRERPEK